MGFLKRGYNKSNKGGGVQRPQNFKKMNATIEHLQWELYLRFRDKLTWRTKDGKEIPLSELSDEHLLNILRLIQQRREEKKIADLIGEDIE